MTHWPAPAAPPHWRSRPVSGLVGPGASPSREPAAHSGRTFAAVQRQGPSIDAPAHTYRCGGSRGLSENPVVLGAWNGRIHKLPATQAPDSEPHLFPVSPGGAERAAEHLERAAQCYRKPGSGVHSSRRGYNPRYESTLRKARYALTRQDFSNYSVVMDTEVAALEEKIQQIVQLCQGLREENRDLRQQLATLLGERRQLSEKVEGAHSRLENLLKLIPE
jgi:cell division protein ZapB